MPLKNLLARRNYKKEWQRQWRDSNPERHRRTGAIAQRLFRSRHPATVRETLKAWRDRNREKWLAHRALYRAIKSGKVVRPPSCSECGHVGRISGHHSDYKQPLKVVWLCHACHMKRHRGED